MSEGFEHKKGPSKLDPYCDYNMYYKSMVIAYAIPSAGIVISKVAYMLSGHNWQRIERINKLMLN